MHFSPDDINGVLNLRLAFPSTDNSVFPANDDGFMEAARERNSSFHNIKINTSALKGFLASSPVNAAEVFRLLTNVVYTILLGTPPEDSIQSPPTT